MVLSEKYNNLSEKCKKKEGAKKSFFYTGRAKPRSRLYTCPTAPSEGATNLLFLRAAPEEMTLSSYLSSGILPSTSSLSDPVSAWEALRLFTNEESPTSTVSGEVFCHLLGKCSCRWPMVTDRQVRRLRELMRRGKTLALAAAKTEMDEKTARRYMRLGKLPSEVRADHRWRTREDPFADYWGEVRGMPGATQ